MAKGAARRKPPWARILVAGLFVLAYVVPPIVLFRAIRAAYIVRKAELAARPGAIAALEHELGMDKPLPPS